MKTKSIRDGFMPWAGLALGTSGYFLAHQIGSDSTFQDCRVGSPWIVILGTLIAPGSEGRSWTSESSGSFGRWTARTM